MSSPSTTAAVRHREKGDPDLHVAQDDLHLPVGDRGDSFAVIVMWSLREKRYNQSEVEAGDRRATNTAKSPGGWHGGIGPRPR